MKRTKSIEGFSQNLFWDVHCSEIDPEQHAAFLIRRVLEYGSLRDWNLLKELYGVERIVEIARTLRTLDKRALSFLVTLSGLSKTEFRCYTFAQSSPQHCTF